MQRKIALKKNHPKNCTEKSLENKKKFGGEGGCDHSDLDSAS